MDGDHFQPTLEPWWWVRWEENSRTRYALFDNADVAARWARECEAFTPYAERFPEPPNKVAQRLAALTA